MAKIKLVRKTKISGTFENVIVQGDVLEQTDEYTKVLVISDVKSELKKTDWRAGETVYIAEELIESIH